MLLPKIVSTSIAFLLDRQVYEKYFLPYRNQSSFSLAPMVMRPKSRGFVKLRSSNPDDAPLIDPRYYSHPDDLKVIVEGEQPRGE